MFRLLSVDSDDVPEACCRREPQARDGVLLSREECLLGRSPFLNQQVPGWEGGGGTPLELHGRCRCDLDRTGQRPWHCPEIMDPSRGKQGGRWPRALAWSRTGSEMTTLATGYQGQEEVLPVSYFMGVLISHALCVGAASVY